MQRKLELIVYWPALLVLGCTTSWNGDYRFKGISRISDIEVGKTTRQDIEAIFGKPSARMSTTSYSYSISRTRATTFPGFLLPTEVNSETKRLLTVTFNENDVVTFVLGPEDGAIELLWKAKQEQSAMRQ